MPPHVLRLREIHRPQTETRTHRTDRLLDPIPLPIEVHHLSFPQPALRRRIHLVARLRLLRGERPRLLYGEPEPSPSPLHSKTPAHPELPQDRSDLRVPRRAALHPPLRDRLRERVERCPSPRHLRPTAVPVPLRHLIVPRHHVLHAPPLERGRPHPGTDDRPRRLGSEHLQ